MSITFDDLEPFENFQGPVHVQHTDGTFVAHGQARIEGGLTKQAFAAVDVNLCIYNETRVIQRVIPGAEIEEVRPADLGYVIVVSRAVQAEDGPSIRTRGA